MSVMTDGSCRLRSGLHPRLTQKVCPSTRAKVGEPLIGQSESDSESEGFQLEVEVKVTVKVMVFKIIESEKLK